MVRTEDREQIVDLFKQFAKEEPVRIIEEDWLRLEWVDIEEYIDGPTYNLKGEITYERIRKLLLCDPTDPTQELIEPRGEIYYDPLWRILYNKIDDRVGLKTYR